MRGLLSPLVRLFFVSRRWGSFRRWFLRVAFDRAGCLFPFSLLQHRLGRRYDLRGIWCSKIFRHTSSSSWCPPIKSRTAPIAALTDDFDFGFAEDKLDPPDLSIAQDYK